MAKDRHFSIILPTFSGQRTISQTFNSLLSQSEKDLKYDLVVVIDGPTPAIEKIVDDYRPTFEAKNISFKVKKFKKNKGRFAARVAGARLADSDQLFFMEDRVYLADDYFEKLKKEKWEIMLSNVLEDKSDSNFISDTLTLIRRAIYGKTWGQDFESYDITAANFEKSPKGMASLWIPKRLFLEVCAEFNTSELNTKERNDDTGVLRIIVDKGYKIYRSSRLKIYYQPRTGLAETIKHLFGRGPKFVDYYLRPGTRFFYLLVSFYIGLALVITALALRPVYLWAVLAAYLLAVALVMLRAARSLGDVLRSLFGLPLVALIFFSGVTKGSIAIMIKGRK